jgi:hypothetical protein
MPPRHAYWTILIGNAPTAFRARDADDLRPTLERLRERHPDVVMKWFARGRLWESPAAARMAGRSAEQPRPREWRPGGDHRDPRDRFTRPRSKPGSRGPAPRGKAGEAAGKDQARTTTGRPFARPRGRVANAKRERDNRFSGPGGSSSKTSRPDRRPQSRERGSGSKPASGQRPTRRPDPKRKRR